MSYDVIRSVRQLIEHGIGDVARLGYILDRLENGKYLYLSDQRYLESLLIANQDIASRAPSSESYAVTNLGKELRAINVQLEKILQSKAKSERRITDNILASHTDSTPRLRVDSKGEAVQPKSQELTLILSVVLGLVSLQGIGHIYIGKIAKGIGIFILSLILYTLSVSYFLGITKDSVPSFLQPYLLPVLIVCYLGLYVFQALDSRKLCAAYNEYVLENKKRPPWW